MGRVKRLLQATKMKTCQDQASSTNKTKPFQLKLILTTPPLLNICFPLKYLKLIERFHKFQFTQVMKNKKNRIVKVARNKAEKGPEYYQ